MDKPNCYKCIYRRKVVGSAHSWCDHPALDGEGDNVFAGVFKVMATGNPVKILAVGLVLKITCEQVWIDKGYFDWPFNFDPTWLLSCRGETHKEESEEEPK